MPHCARAALSPLRHWRTIAAPRHARCGKCTLVPRARLACLRSSSPSHSGWLHKRCPALAAIRRPPASARPLQCGNTLDKYRWPG